jgi:hypothetical protein
MILERHKYRKRGDEWFAFKTWILEYDTYEYTPENVKLVSDMIRKKLSPKFLSTQFKEDNQTNPMFGHCYHSTQALYYFLKCDILESYSGKDSLGNTHWWLQDGSEIIDVTAAQYDLIPCDPPYEVGKRTKWYGWHHRPHKRSMELMKLVQPSARLYCVGPNANTLF